MKTIEIKTPGYSYPVYIGKDILGRLSELLKKHYAARQVAIITSENIDALYGNTLRKGFGDDQKVITLCVPEGESAKSLEQAQRLYTRLLENNFERGAVIVALGGGVIGDLAGFIAATYLRGVELAQVPTTLLAQVDSSVGGKVGVNHPLGKNLIGAFKHPLFVLADVGTLQTLAEEEIRCGLGEVIKYGFIANRKLFDYFDKNLNKALLKDEEILNHLIQASVADKVDVVQKDEKEQNLRMILNFGHTFGHALEADLQFGSLKHGEAVILGMKCALQYEKLNNNIAPEEYKRGMSVLDRIPINYDKAKILPQQLADRMLLDKKVKDGKVRLVLVNKIGDCRIEPDGDREAMIKAFKVLKE